MSGESTHRNGHARPVEGGADQGKPAGTGVAAGAADGEDALRLRIQVQHLPPLQRRHIDGSGPQQTDLLIHSEYSLQPGVGQILRIQQGQRYSYGNAVIAPKGGALGIDKVSVHRQVQTLRLISF